VRPEPRPEPPRAHEGARTGTSSLGEDISPVLEIENLSVVYQGAGGDVAAVRDVSLSLAPGEIVGLAGESGSGKSTLAYGACRLLRPPALITTGQVRYYGRRVTPAGISVLDATPEELQRLRWREIAIVFQSAMNALNPVLRVESQIVDVIETHLELAREKRLERAGALLDLVGIPRARLRSYPHELSGGMRQRVMIAMALATDPEVVIMDEPTTALDVVLQREIIGEIVELKSQLGFGVLFITHDLSLLLEIADRVAIMYAGRLVEVGSAKAIREQPAHPYTEGLLNSFPSLHGARRELVGIPGSPPDLRELPSGCTFRPRCAFARPECEAVDMRLCQVASVADAGHLSACPFARAGELRRVHGAREPLRGDTSSREPPLPVSPGVLAPEAPGVRTRP
jgi:oligopeptide/dipeptide ABC transporter ATP-binding protein